MGRPALDVRSGAAGLQPRIGRVPRADLSRHRCLRRHGLPRLGAAAERCERSRSVSGAGRGGSADRRRTHRPRRARVGQRGVVRAAGGAAGGQAQRRARRGRVGAGRSPGRRTASTPAPMLSRAATPTPSWPGAPPTRCAAATSCTTRGRSMLDALDACAASIAGAHDFTAFTPSETQHVFFDRTVRNGPVGAGRRPAGVRADRRRAAAAHGADPGRHDAAAARSRAVPPPAGRAGRARRPGGRRRRTGCAWWGSATPARPSTRI